MSASHPMLKEGNPAEAGLDAAALERAAAALTQAVDQNQISAASLTVARGGVLALSRGFGRMRPEAGAPKTAADAVFLLASITKPVTACALVRLAEEGKVSLNDPVDAYLPEFTGGSRAKVKVKHLLSHVSGMPDMLPHNVALRQRHAPLADFVDGALHTPLIFEPATSFSYQSKGTLLAAEIVERVSGRPLREYEREIFFEPLGMRRSALGLGDFSIEDTVWCGTETNEDEETRSWGWNTPYWRDLGAPWGGMHSCGPDLAVFLQAMLQGGAYGAERVLSPAAVGAMTRDQNRNLNAPWGLGWALADSVVWSCSGELVAPEAFGHTGATGTVAWADPISDLVCVVLTNQMVGGGSLLRRVSNAVAAAVRD
jgi:CubicO group peptidase (beta-lactamase class C family)